MNSHQQQSRGGEDQKPAAGHATTAGTATTLVDTSDGGIGMGELWDTLTSEFTNMGYALRCPLCLCTYKEAVLLPCCHAYCKDCVLAAFQQSQPRCPTCLIKANKRSLQPADILNQLVHAYKVSLRHFGLAPVTYDPSYNAMTQLGPGESPEKGMMSMEPLTRYNDDASSSSTRALLDCHTHLQVSRTWQSVLQERQELRDEEDNTDDDDDSDDDDEKSRAVDVDLNPKQTSKTTATASVPSNIPTKSRLHHWYQQQQAQVIASHERALIVAAREKRESNSSPVLNLSEQHEIAYEQALEQSAADQRWTQESGTASAGASASQAFLTPREADSNPQQQQQQQQQPIPSLSAAESFETTLEEEHPVKLRRDEMEADKYKSDKSEDVTMQEETTKENIEGDQGKEEEDSVMDDTEEHNTSTSTTNAINNSTRATPQQSNTMAYRQTNDAKAEDSDDETVFDIDDDGKNKDATNEDPMEVDDNDNINTATTTRNNMDVPMNQEAECKDDNDDDDDKGIAAENTSIVNQERNNHADAQDNNATTSDSNNATAGAANASLATPTSPSALQFKKGDIVHVQSRTWPGVNKQGGIGRVTKVNAKSSSYHIEYILGGREKDVDAVFVSNPPDEIAIIKEEPNNTSDDNETTKNNACSGRERKSRRILKKEQHIDTAINPEDVLPPELMERLAKEGFDVTPTAANGAGKENAVPGGGVRVKTEPGVRRGRTNNNGRSTRSRSETRRGRTSTAASTRRAKSEGAQSRTTNARTGNSRGRSKKQPLQDTKIPATNTDSDKNVPAEKNDNSEESKKATAAKAIAKKITVKATKASAKGKQPASSKSALNTITAANKRQKTAASDSPTKLPPLPDSTAEICKLADANYQERIQGALDGGVLTIVSSGLSEIDKSDLKTLCREAKKNGNGMSNPGTILKACVQ